MSAAEIPRLWAGEQVYIIGGGYIPRRCEIERLPGDRVIGCNGMGAQVHAAAVAIWSDDSWLRRAGVALLRSAPHYGHRMRVARQAPTIERAVCEKLDIVHIPAALDRATNLLLQWSDTPNALGGIGAGACAINFAALAGAGDIVLFGFTGRELTDEERGDSRTAGRPGGGSQSTRRWRSTLRPDVEHMAPHLERHGIGCRNATPATAVTVFPQADPFEVIDDATRT